MVVNHHVTRSLPHHALPHVQLQERCVKDGTDSPATIKGFDTSRPLALSGYQEREGRGSLGSVYLVSPGLERPMFPARTGVGYAAGEPPWSHARAAVVRAQTREGDESGSDKHISTEVRGEDGGVSHQQLEFSRTNEMTWRSPAS